MVPCFNRLSHGERLLGYLLVPLDSGINASHCTQPVWKSHYLLQNRTPTGTTPTGTYPLLVTATGAVNGVSTPRTVTVPVLVLATGTTTFSGLVLDEEAKPVKGALVKIGAAQVSTDDGGNFLMQNPPVGANQVLFIDGGPASTPGKSLPIIPYKVTIVSGQANMLSFIPHLHYQKTTGLVDISNSGVERIVTDLELPGFQMRIPAGAQIIGWDGQPNTQVSVRRVPIDRIPVPPIPAGLFGTAAYMDYFGKPGGGTPTEPIPVTLPNDLDLPPGAQAELWYFDEAPDGSRPNQWAKYGTGTVSQDGSQIVPDIDPATGKQFGQPRFCCGINMAAIIETARQFYFGGGSPSAGGDSDGDPVNLATGLLTMSRVDMALPGRLSIALTRSYQTNGTATGPFGRGTTHALQIGLLMQGNQRIVRMGDNKRFILTLQTDGTYRNTTDAMLQGAVLTESSGVPSLRWKDGARWVFGTSINLLTRALTQTIDRNGNTITSTWSGANITAIMGPDGRQLLLDYDGAGRITRVTDPIGRAVLYAYDGQGNLATVTDPEGGTTRYAYDSNNRLTTITDPKGITFLQNFYGPSGRVLRQVMADGGEYRFRYQLTGGTSSGAGCTSVTGNLVSVTLPFVACPTVDSWENLQAGYTITGGAVTATTVVDPRGNATITRFNIRGYRTSVTDALGQTNTMQLNAANQVISSTDPLGRVTKIEYDVAGNVKKIVDPNNQSIQLEYHPIWNRITKVTDALNRVTELSYDPANGNLLSVTDPLSHTTMMAYSAFGQPISVQGPIATESPTTFAYDTNGNLITTTDPLGNSTQRLYDAVSRLTALTDPRGLQTQFRYDGLNRVTEIADARQGIARFTYDPNGNLLTVSDAKNQATRYTYDSMDRVKTRTDALTRSETYTYDLVSNLKIIIDRNNQQTAFDYDALNRRVKATYQGDGTEATFTYDNVGRLTKASDTAPGAGSIDFAYDTLNRLIQETTGQGSVNYQYDVLGRRTQMVANGQQPVMYSYDSASRLTQVMQGSLAVGLGYDNANRRTSLTYPNGTSTSYTYDVASRLTSMNHLGPGGIIEALTYQYDVAGNQTSLTRNNGTASSLPPAVTNASYDVVNEQTAFAGAALTYDNNGNLTSDGTNTYVWDARNRLVAISGGVTASFTYDPLGRRISKTVNSVLSQYGYDGNDIVMEIGGGAVGASYLRSLRIDEPFIRQSSTGNEHYHTDPLGNSMVLSNSQGGVVSSYSYEPFGKSSATGGSANTLKYTGREEDGTGLVYYRARYMNPRSGRFLSRDPQEDGGLSGNLYAYVGNNPLSYTDPLGLFRVPLKPLDPPPQVKIYGGNAGTTADRSKGFLLPTIACDGDGGIKVWLPEGFGANDQCGESTCVRRHERSHVLDAYAANPKICKDIGNNIMVEPVRPIDSARGEYKAYAVEADCYETLKNRTAKCGCKETLQKRQAYATKTMVDIAIKNPDATR
jgi:RHS repeat-associated protein